MTLTAIEPNLWTITQPLRFFGLEVGSRMTIIRLPSQALALISPIELNTSQRKAIAQLGPVRWIIAPNVFHHLSIATAQAAFLNAQAWGVAALQTKRPDLQIDTVFERAGTLETTLDYLPLKGFGTLLPQGIRLLHETVFLHRPSRTLILTDIAFNFGPESALLTQLLTQSVGIFGRLSPSPLERLGSRDRAAAKASLEQVLAWDFDRIIPGHGSIIDSDGKAQLCGGYRWLLKKSYK